LQSISDIDNIIERSTERPQVIFKHSTRCPVSSMARNRLEKADQPENIDFHFLDLIRYRDVSNKIAADFHVHHESPQVLIIKNGQSIFNESHSAIRMDDIVQNATLTS